MCEFLTKHLRHQIFLYLRQLYVLSKQIVKTFKKKGSQRLNVNKGKYININKQVLSNIHFVSLRSEVVENMGRSQFELVLYRRHPEVSFQTQHRLVAGEVQSACEQYDN